jgi:hypothetical protein
LKIGECIVPGESTKVENPESERAGEGGGRGEAVFLRSFRRSRMVFAPVGEWHPQVARLGEGWRSGLAIRGGQVASDSTGVRGKEDESGGRRMGERKGGSIAVRSVYFHMSANFTSSSREDRRGLTDENKDAIPKPLRNLVRCRVLYVGTVGKE